MIDLMMFARHLQGRLTRGAPPPSDLAGQGFQMALKIMALLEGTEDHVIFMKHEVTGYCAVLSVGNCRFEDEVRTVVQVFMFSSPSMYQL